MNEEPSDFEVLALLAKVLADKSPADFAEWSGCDIDTAIVIYSTAVACLMGEEHDA